MELERIRKRPEEYVGANLVDYDECAKTFSWTQARGLLDGFPGGGLNIAHEAIDRHVKAGRGDKLALRWIGRDDSIRDFTYATLGAAVNRFANVLTQYGIAKGDRVSSLLGRVPELYIGVLGTLKNGSVFSPMFSAFGPEPIKARMAYSYAAGELFGFLQGERVLAVEIICEIHERHASRRLLTSLHSDNGKADVAA